MDQQQVNRRLPTCPNQELRFVYNPSRQPSSCFNLFHQYSHISNQPTSNKSSSTKKMSRKQLLQQPEQNEMRINFAQKISHYRYKYIVQKLNKQKKINCASKYCSCSQSQLSFQQNNRQQITKMQHKSKSYKKYPVLKGSINNQMQQHLPILSQQKYKKNKAKFNEQINFRSFGNNNQQQFIEPNGITHGQIQCTFHPKISKKSNNNLRKWKQKSKMHPVENKLDENSSRNQDNSSRQNQTNMQTQYLSSSQQYSIINSLSSRLKQKQPTKSSCRSGSKLSIFSNVFKTSEKIKTVFAMSNQVIKNEIDAIRLNNSSLNGDSIRVQLPQQHQYGTFLKDYKPLGQIFDIKKLIKRENFSIIKNINGIYFGQVQDGQRNGIGLLIGNKEILQGIFQDDQIVEGVQKTNQGIYRGYFVNGKRSGNGIFQWRNEQKFEGQWKNGIKDGNGTWTSPDGSSYVGEWHNNKQQGNGIFKHKKSVYKGSFKDFFKEGKGQQKFSNGDCYIGDYVKGKPNGQGTYMWKQGHIYEGNFVQGFRQGYGRFVDCQGNIYMGNFLRDEKSGQGKEIYKSGEIYVGKFKKGIKSQGKIYGKDETQIEITQ